MLDYTRQGGVSFSHASAVFNIYSEVHLTTCQPSLTFASWVNAIQHILRGPAFYRTQREVVFNLFGVCLKRCERVMSISPLASVGTSPSNRSRQCSALSATSGESGPSGSPRGSSQ